MAIQIKNKLHEDLWRTDWLVYQIKQYAKISPTLNDHVISHKVVLADAVNISIGYCCNRRPAQEDFEEIIEELVVFSFLIIGASDEESTIEKNILCAVAEIITALIETNTTETVKIPSHA